MIPVRKRDLFRVPDRSVQTPEGTVTIEVVQPVLRCACGEFSASPGDYWHTPEDEVLHCDECDEDMELGFVRRVWEAV